MKKIRLNSLFENDALNLRLVGVMILTGISAGLVTFVFHWAVKLLSQLIGSHQTFTWWTFLASLALVVLSYFLSQKIFPDTAGSGIPQVKLAIVALKGKMPKRMPFGKLITSILTLSSGLSFGMEGPSVTISASMAHLYSHLMKLGVGHTKLMVTAGTAAGLSAAFHTPIAAVIFTIEEIIGQLNSKYFGPIVITAVVASVTSYKLLGGHPTFIQVNYAMGKDWHLILYMLLGAILGAIGPLWVQLIVKLKDFKLKYFTDKEYFYLAIVVIVTGMFSIWSHTILGNGISTINDMIAGKSFSIIFCLSIFLVKFFLSAFSYSTGLSGGLFMPVLFLGAILGTIFGEGMLALGLDQFEMGTFALIGMTSFLVAVIKTPFTAFVMLFEMTRDYEFILPLMMATIVAHFVSEIFSNESVYEVLSNYEGVHLPGNNDTEFMQGLIVENCMTRQLITLEGSMGVQAAFEKIKTLKCSGFPVIKNNQLIGIVLKKDLADNTGENVLLEKICRKDLIVIHADESLLTAMHKMQRYELGRLPVVSRYNSKHILGIVTFEDIAKYFEKVKNTEPS